VEEKKDVDRCAPTLFTLQDEEESKPM